MDMKRLLLITLMIVCSLGAYSQKIADLPAAVSTVGTDIIIVEDAVATAQMTITNLFGTIPVNTAVTGTVTTTGNITATGSTITGYILVVDSADIDTLSVTDVATVAGVLTAEKIEALRTTEQFRLSYDAGNYITATLLDDGHTTFTTVDPDGTEADINFNPDGNVGIKTAAPGTALEVTGVTTSTGGFTDGSFTVDGAGSFTGVVNFAATGVITGLTQVTLDTDASFVLAAGDCDNAVRINNDADVVDYTLPGAATGLVVMFYDISGE